jgi:hypothetical protein
VVDPDPQAATPAAAGAETTNASARAVPERTSFLYARRHRKISVPAAVRYAQAVSDT